MVSHEHRKVMRKRLYRQAIDKQDHAVCSGNRCVFPRHPKACDNHAEVYDASCKEGPSEPEGVRMLDWFHFFLQLSEKPPSSWKSRVSLYLTVHSMHPNKPRLVIAVRFCLV